MIQHIDDKGRTWNCYTCSFFNETDNKEFCFEIWAIDFAHAQDQLSWLKANGKIDGQLAERIPAK